MKQRLDVLLVERGLAPSRTVARAMIMAGEIRLGTTALTKPGMPVDIEAELTVVTRSRYVSRGGDKLQSVAAVLSLNFNDAVVLDVGSSTGGFTDYVLQHGASHVHAVDVGTNQLAYKLRQDPRVTVCERTDIRTVTPDQLEPSPTVAVIDVSFISLTKVLPTIVQLLVPGSLIVAMMKPQFETDKATADRYNGVIRDEAVRQGIIAAFEESITSVFRIEAAADSEVHGAQGNRERFYLLRAEPDSKTSTKR